MPRPSQLLMIGVIAFLAGCNRSDAPAPPAASTGPSTPPAVVAEPPEQLTPGLVSVEPAELKSCDKLEVVSVRWNVNQVEPEVQLVEVWTGPAANESVFASGGKTGEGVTGPWAMPGTIFTLKDKGTGKVLSRTTVGGPACS